jgi:hypothetical protein
MKDRKGSTILLQSTEAAKLSIVKYGLTRIHTWELLIPGWLNPKAVQASCEDSVMDDPSKRRRGRLTAAPSADQVVLRTT